MQNPFFAVINPYLFSPPFAFTHDYTQHHISHNASQGSRNASNRPIEFPDFQELSLLSTLKGKPISFVKINNVFVI